jgi:chromosome segregation ATPase
MAEWLEKNAAVLVGWLGTIAFFAFVFGRKLQKLESTDSELAKAIAALTVTLNEIVSSRVSANEASTHAHEVRLARLEEMRASTNEKLTSLAETLALLSNELRVVSTMVTRVDQQISDIKSRVSGRPESA